MKLSRTNEAKLAAKQAVDSGFAPAWLLVMLGVTCFQSGDAGNAIAWWRRALALDPDSPHAVRNLMALSWHRQDWDHVGELVERALRLWPSDAEILVQAADWFMYGSNPSRARQLLDLAQSSETQDTITLRNCASSLLRLGCASEAMETLDRLSNSLTHPDPYIETMRASGKLVQDLEDQQAWARYESRRDAFPDRYFPGTPGWDGSKMTKGRLLAYGEQGIGDVLLFARFIPSIVDAARVPVTLAVPSSIGRLLRDTALSQRWSNVEVVELPPMQPITSEYGAAMPLLSAIHVLGVPVRPTASAYLSVSAELREAWKGRLGGRNRRLRVGLVWAGNPARDDDWLRSIPLKDLSRLAAADDVEYVLLQKDARPEYLTQVPAVPSIDLRSSIRDFADSAALMLQLDGVISIDTAAAHLAGALALPTLVLLPQMPDWRWESAAVKSPWYTSVTIARCGAPRDWSGPLQRALDWLRELKTNAEH
jgi:Tfp pilus assembly protein PilF